MNIYFLRKAIAQNNIRLSLFKIVKGVPSKIKFQQTFTGRSSVVVSTGGEKRYQSKRKDDEVSLHSINLLLGEERLKKTYILVFLSSLLQRIFQSCSLIMGAIGFDGA